MRLIDKQFVPTVRQHGSVRFTRSCVRRRAHALRQRIYIGAPTTAATHAPRDLLNTREPHHWPARWPSGHNTIDIPLLSDIATPHPQYVPVTDLQWNIQLEWSDFTASSCDVRLNVTKNSDYSRSLNRLSVNVRLCLFTIPILA